MFLKLVILTAFCCTNIIAANKNRFRIYGGQVVPLIERNPISGAITVRNTGEFPYLVTLEHKSGYHICGGSLIRDDVVLTAAHCTDKLQSSALLLRAGAALIQENSPYVQVRDVAYFVMHETYDAQIIHNDITLIKPVTPFKLNNIVNLVKLPKSSDNFYGKKGTIVGWGETESTYLSQILKKSTVNLINPNQCATYFQPIPITYHMICGVGVGTGICTGDSGGPMTIHDPSNPENDVLVGVNSWVSKPAKVCDTRFPSVFADLVPLLSWIEKQLKTKF